MMNFPDTVTLYKVTYEDAYNEPTLDEGHEVRAAFEQPLGWSHSDHQDAVTSDARLWLDADNSFLIEENYRIEGYMVLANFFGANNRDQFFKITSVHPVRDTLLDNQVQHVECDLEKAPDFTGVSIS